MRMDPRQEVRGRVQVLEKMVGAIGFEPMTSTASRHNSLVYKNLPRLTGLLSFAKLR